MTTITLYEFPTAPGFFNSSPYCNKVEILLKLAGIEFTAEMPEDYKSFSKGKLPVIKDGDTIIEDSEFIRAYLAEKYGATLDAGLSDTDKAVGHTLCRMLDDRTILGLVWARWVEDSGWEQIKQVFFEGDPSGEGEIVRANIREGIIGAGFGNHTDEEKRTLIGSDIDALATLLGDKDWFFSGQPTYLDATIWSFIANFYASPIQTWISPLVARHANLVAYFNRGMQRWYPEGVTMLEQSSAA